MQSVYNRFSGLSLKAQIISIFIIGSLIISVSLFFYVQGMSKTMLTNNLSLVLDEVTQSLSSEAEAPIQLQNEDKLETIAKETVERDNPPLEFVVFVDPEGNILAEVPPRTGNQVLGMVGYQSDADVMDKAVIEEFNDMKVAIRGNQIKNVGGKVLGTVYTGINYDFVQGRLSSYIWYASGLIFALTLLVIVIIYFIVERMVTRPLINLAERLAEGDLRGKDGHRDLHFGGQLGEAFDQMRLNLADLIKDLQDYSSQTAEMAETVLSSSEELKRVSDEQNHQIEESSSAITELSQSVQEVAERTSQGEKIAEESRQLAEEGGEQVAEVIREMNSIQESVDETAQEVDELGKSGEEIGKIVGEISQIAEQTSLLALNAAVEAARAGEEGKGFAVVADEVSRLADRVGDSADEIEDLIESIQTQTQKSVRSMDQMTEKVDSGVEVVDKAGSVLDEIVSSAGETLEEIQSIASSMKQQATASDEVADNTEKVSQSSEEVVKSANELVQQGEELDDLSSEMEKLSRQFQIDQ